MNEPCIVFSLDEVGSIDGPLHLAIGMFDGVHLGHQALIDAARQSACRTWGVSGVLTFDPHPSRIFRPDNPTQLMMPVHMKTSFLHYQGIDLVINQPFDAAFAAIEAEAFPHMLKAKLPQLSSLYIGENFRFGKGRRGDVGDLIRVSADIGLSVFSVERIKQNGEPISSTRIRSELSAGNIATVNNLLGYTYRSQGQVTNGRQLGRTIGFPTLNMIWNPELKPRFGVYAVKVKTPKASVWLSGVANYGARPTVEIKQPTHPLLEVHLFEQPDLGNGDELYVEWFHFIRPETTFANVDNLKLQIEQDKAQAQELLLGSVRF